MKRKDVPAAVIDIHHSLGVIPLFLIPTSTEITQSSLLPTARSYKPHVAYARRVFARERMLDQIFGNVWENVDGAKQSGKR